MTVATDRQRNALPKPRPPSPLGEFGLAELAAIRLLLHGRSIIDWHRIDFADGDAVDRFLRVNEFDVDDEIDIARLETLRGEAVDYLERNFSFRIPPEIAEAMPVRDVFLLAAQRGRRQTFACMILKVMQIIHHLAGRELLLKLPIAGDELFQLVEAKVMSVVEGMRAAGHPIVEFAWSRKNADSLVTKLLAKRESIAAHVYDKLRFRLVTRSESDLLPVLRELTGTLISFNYVIPGESQNSIIPDFGAVDRIGESDAGQPATPRSESATTGPNEFSGPGYRVINFVVDLPVKIRDYLARSGLQHPESGDVVFVLTEFQIVDATTALTNEQGENSHQAYKERQIARVRARLLQGATRERGDRTDRHSTPGDGSGSEPGSGRGPIGR